MVGWNYRDRYASCLTGKKEWRGSVEKVNKKMNFCHLFLPYT